MNSPGGRDPCNTGIPKETFSIRYISVDVAMKVLMELGARALMAKFDVLSAYLEEVPLVGLYLPGYYRLGRQDLRCPCRLARVVARCSRQASY